jgi:hypothetical protein
MAIGEQQRAPKANRIPRERATVAPSALQKSAISIIIQPPRATFALSHFALSHSFWEVAFCVPPPSP